MAECTTLTWLLLFYISSRAQSVRSLSGGQNQANCLESNYEEIQLQYQTPAGVHVFGGRVWQDDPEFHVMSEKVVTSLMMLCQAAWEMLFTQGRRKAIAWAVVCVLLAIVFAVAWVRLCKRGSPTSSAREVDDDSDDSVVGLGEDSDPVVWWNSSTLSTIITSTSEVPAINLIVPPWSSTALNNFFKEFGLENQWTEGINSRVVDKLRGELSPLGTSGFFSQSRSEHVGLTCIIDVMQLALHYVPDNLILQEFTDQSDNFRLPTTAIRNCERVEDCFLHWFTLKLGVSHSIAEKFARSAVLLRSDEEPTTESVAATIPNMATTARKFTVLVQLKDADDKLRKALGIDEGSLSVGVGGVYFRWEKVGEDCSLQKLLKKAPDARKVKSKLQPSGSAVLPWSASDVNQELTSRGISPASFGEDLPFLVHMLRHGQVQLGTEESTEKLVCVEHRVYLKLSKRNGDFLVYKGDDSKPACLPYVQLLANERPLVAALRAARTKLGSVFMRVELQLRVQDVHSTFTPKPPKMFSNGQPIKYVVRELLVEALARA